MCLMDTLGGGEWQMSEISKSDWLERQSAEKLLCGRGHPPLSPGPTLAFCGKDRLVPLGPPHRDLTLAGQRRNRVVSLSPCSAGLIQSGHDLWDEAAVLGDD